MTDSAPTQIDLASSAPLADEGVYPLTLKVEYLTDPNVYADTS